MNGRKFSQIKASPLLLKILVGLGEYSGHGLQASGLLQLSLLVVFRLQDGVVLLGILQSVTDEFNPQSLNLYFTQFLLGNFQLHGQHKTVTELQYALVGFDDTCPHAQLFLERLIELEHVKVGHEDKVVLGSLLQGLDGKVVHEGEVVEEDGAALMEEGQVGVHLFEFDYALHDGQQTVDDVVKLEDPYEADLGTATVDVVIWNLPRSAVHVQLLVGPQLHLVVIERHQQLLQNILLQSVRRRIDLPVTELAGPDEQLDLLAKDEVSDVKIRGLGNFDDEHHDLDLLGGSALVLEVLGDDLDKVLLLFVVALAVYFQAGGNGLFLERVRGQVAQAQLLLQGIFLQDSMEQLHLLSKFIITHPQLAQQIPAELYIDQQNCYSIQIIKLPEYLLVGYGNPSQTCSTQFKLIQY